MHRIVTKTTAKDREREQGGTDNPFSDLATSPPAPPAEPISPPVAPPSSAAKPSEAGLFDDDVVEAVPAATSNDAGEPDNGEEETFDTVPNVEADAPTEVPATSSAETTGNGTTEVKDDKEEEGEVVDV